MGISMKTDCRRCGLTDELLTTPEALNHDRMCAWIERRGISRDRLCPVHLISDCSPLLNGCARLTSAT